MSKRRKLVILLACGVVVAIAVWLFHQEPEPSYNGRSLEEWVSRLPPSYSQGHSDSHYLRRDGEAQEAVRHIGTNALPYLLDWIHYHTPFWQAFLSHNAEMKLRNDLNLRLADRSITAFEILGPTAESAIPELEDIAMTAHPHGRSRAVDILSFLGPQAFAPLLSIVTNTQDYVRAEALFVIGNLGTNARPAIPVLLKYLKSSQPFDASSAAHSLGKIGVDPERVVPALIPCLRSREDFDRWRAAESIGKFGAAARQAVPDLQQLLDDPSANARKAATNALLKIAPEVLTNTPAQ